MVSTDTGVQRLNDDYPAYAWFISHEDELDVYVGNWVAIGPVGLTSVSPDLDLAVDEARRKGVEVPFIHFIKDLELRTMLRA